MKESYECEVAAHIGPESCGAACEGRFASYECVDAHSCDHIPMRAFEVHLNGKQLCLAGIGDDGVLTAIANWVGSKRGSDLSLDVGGLISPTEQYVSWVRRCPLRVGDKITVRVVEKKAVDEPTIKYRFDPTKELKNEKIYVRKMAKKLGWTIQARPKSRKTN